MSMVEKAARLARLLVAAALIVGLVPATASAAPKNLPILSIASTSANEGDSGTTPMTFTVTMSKTSAASVTLKYATAAGSALPGSDFAAATGGLTLAAGETSKTVTVNVNGDTVDEINETFTVALSGAKGARIRGGAATGTINDDDSPPNLSVDDITVSEGNAGTSNATFTVTLGSPSSSPVTVNYLTANVSATSPDDYVATTGSVAFAPGETAKSVNVALVGDILDEEDETFQLKLQNAVGSVISKSTGLATVTDDDFTPVISVNSPVVTELGSGNTTTAVFTVSLSGPSSQTVTVNYATADGTATTADGDYNAKNGILTFLSGGPLTQQVDVTINGDDTAEDPNETFTLALSNPSNATLSGSPVGTATINDDDASPKVSINDVVVNEGDETTTATFTLTLSNASASNITASMTTADLTADAGQDYTAKTQDVTINAGQRTATFTVDVTGDNVDENSQTFSATITQLQGGGASIGDPDAHGIATILDDESAPLVSVNDVSVREGDKDTKNATFAVTLSHPTEKGITVNVRTSDGSAKFAAADYHRIPVTPVSSVAFNENETSMPVAVPVVGDRKLEPNEAFNLNLSGSTNSIIADGQGKATILNNDITVSLRVTKLLSSVRANGFLRPAHPGKKMVVRYYKRTASGTWRLLGTKRPTLSVAKDFNGDGKKESKYSTRFARRSGSRCKLVAKFARDTEHRAGQVKKIFSC
jgi:Calx-beta domain